MKKTSLTIDSAIIKEFQDDSGTLAHFATRFMQSSVELASYYQGQELHFVSNYMSDLKMLLKLLNKLEIGTESEGIQRLTEEERENLIQFLEKITSKSDG